MPKLTKTAVETFTTGFLWDSELPSFGVRCTSSGRKTYLIRYRNKYGQSKMYTFARTCDMPPDKARSLARELFAKVAEGVDISEERKSAKEAPTVAELMRTYLEHITPNMKPSTMVSYRIAVEKHIIPRLGNAKTVAVTDADIRRFLGNYADHPGIKYRTYNILHSAFRLAEKWGIRPKHSHPMDEIERPAMDERGYVLSREEIQRLMVELDSGRWEIGFVRLVKLLLLTGCRRGEIATAETSWVDLERGLLRLPDSKTGAKTIVLSEAAMELIRPTMAQRFICQRPNGENYYHCYATWVRFRKACGLPSVVRMHDLRHTVGTAAHFAGMSQREVADLLGHKQLRTTERYLHGNGQGRQNAERLASIMKMGA